MDEKKKMGYVGFFVCLAVAGIALFAILSWWGLLVPAIVGMVVSLMIITDKI
jgi:type III secretory pathway component EscS